MPEDTQRWRAAQEGADELARMGIDPSALGLRPPSHPTVDPDAAAPEGGEVGTAPPRAPHPGPAHHPDTLRWVRARTGAPTTGGTPPATGTTTPGVSGGATAPTAGGGTGAATTAGAGPDTPASAAGTTPPAGAVDGAGPLAAAATWGALERVAHPSAAPSPRWRHHVRTAALGALQPGAAAAVERERRLVARVRARHPEPRAVAFLAGKGGVGTTTTAAGVALTLAALRPDPVALVCARSGTGSLGHRLGGAPAPAVASLVSGAAAQPAWARERLAVVDGAPWHSPTRQEELLRLLAELRTRYPLTLLDVGNDLTEAAQAALRRADQVVLVTTASQDAVDATRIALGRVHQVDPFRLGTVVVALTSLYPRQARRTARRLRQELGPGGARLVPVPYDPVAATGQPLDLARMRPATREAYLRIAGLIAEPGEAEAWLSRPTRVGSAG